MVIAILATGAVSTVASVVKVIVSFEIERGAGVNTGADINLTVSTLCYWSMIEAGLAVIATCLPTLQHLVRKASLGRIISSIRGPFSDHSVRSQQEIMMQMGPYTNITTNEGSVSTIPKADATTRSDVVAVGNEYGSLKIPDGQIYVATELYQHKDFADHGHIGLSATMAGHAKKATKKFEKNRLKDTLERRKEFAKIKQRNQVKAKKKAKNAKDNATAIDPEATPASNTQPKKHDDFNNMSVDQFFQGGFELPELKKTKPTTKSKPGALATRKRKRGSDDASSHKSNSSSEVDNYPLSDEEQKSEDQGRIDNHQVDLDALAQKDPDFYKYLQENDAELLDFGDGDLAEVDQLSEDEKPKKKQRKGGTGPIEDDTVQDENAEEINGQVNVTVAMVLKWKTAMVEQQSLRAMRQVVLAFRTAAFANADDGKEHKYTVSDPDVYHQLLMLALEHVPTVLQHHVPAKESSTGKVRVATDSKKYRTLTPLLKSYVAAVMHLLENLSDAPTLKKTLDSLVPLLPYLLSFKKVLKSLVKSTVDIWADTATADTTRITAFLMIRRLAVISDASVRTALLKTTYQGLVKGSRVTNPHTLSAINLMKNSAAELWGIDPEIGYTTGFVYIRQLAVHLRSTITQPTKDSYKQIYNWQYVHSLDFWSRMLSTHCSPASNPLLKAASDSPLHPLLYPLVQITLGALRLIPTPTYYPLRFHLTRSLLRLSRATTTYIPLAPSLLEVLQSAEMTKPPKPSTLKPLDFATVLRVPKQYLRTRTHQDGVGEQLVELMAEAFGIWAKSIAFPELVLPPVVHLKRWIKTSSSTTASTNDNSTNSNPDPKFNSKPHKNNKNPRLTSSLRLLVQKLESQARFVEERRRQVEFGPSNREGVDGFLREWAWGDTPLGA
ncbi:MAG: hypothetical protein Q9219_005838, partial [cf. Caloplaca sp. 3 TL-2023]